MFLPTKIKMEIMIKDKIFFLIFFFVTMEDKIIEKGINKIKANSE